MCNFYHREIDSCRNVKHAAATAVGFNVSFRFSGKATVSDWIHDNSFTKVDSLLKVLNIWRNRLYFLFLYGCFRLCLPGGRKVSERERAAFPFFYSNIFILRISCVCVFSLRCCPKASEIQRRLLGFHTCITKFSFSLNSNLCSHPRPFRPAQKIFPQNEIRIVFSLSTDLCSAVETDKEKRPLNFCWGSAGWRFHSNYSRIYE